MMSSEETSSSYQESPGGEEAAPDSRREETVDAPSEESVPEDDLELLAPTSRSLDTSPSDPAEGTGGDSDSLSTPSSAAAASDDVDDAASIADEPETPDEPADRVSHGPVGHAAAAHHVAVELKRIEADVRAQLERFDSKRKRKLGGTRRWLELEEDIAQWRYSSRVDEKAIAKLQQLIARRHYLFRRLRFYAGTRPTWNS